MYELEASLAVTGDQDGTLFDQPNGFGNIDLAVKNFLPGLNTRWKSFCPEEFSDISNRKFVHPDLFGGFGDRGGP